MTQEDKKLLLKDLSARLPYKLKVHRKWVAPLGGSLEEKDTELESFDIDCIKSIIECGTAICTIDGHTRDIRKYKIKPYLRPLSSMTKEEATEYANCGNIIETLVDGCYLIPNPKSIDWLNKNHFDYRGLIPMGLALEASEGMYKAIQI